MTEMTRTMNTPLAPWTASSGRTRAIVTQGPRAADEPRPNFAAALQGARQQAWDPHEVWLSRVKKPRDDQRGGR